MIDDLYTNLEKMMIDIAKIRQAAERANAGIESVLGVLHEQSVQLKEQAEKLTAAIASADPIAQAAVQAELDRLADGLASEADRIAAAVVAPAANVHVAAVDTAAPAAAG